MALEERRLDKEPCLSAAGTTDDQDIFIPGILGFLGTARHGDPLRLGHGDVVEKILVHVRGDVGRRAPTGAPVLDTAAVFLRVLALGVDRQPDQHCAGGAHAQVHQVEAGRQTGKGRRKALPNVEQLLRGVRPRSQPHTLTELVKEIHEDEIREVEDELFFQLVGHRATSRSLVLTFSRSRCLVLDCSWAWASFSRMVGRFSRFRVMAVNSLKAGWSWSLSLALKNT